MYNMVEEIDDGQTKLLFLTNPQAEQIASTPESIQKLLDALEIPKPSLVIELLGSWGSRFSTESESPEWFAQAATSHAAGVLHGNPPFLSREDERAAAAKIDMFMADVLIPLAAQTNAVVLCGATGNDLLSASFTRMYSVTKHRWCGPPPFTIISTSSAIESLYRNPNESAYWRRLRKASRAWCQRNEKLLSLFDPKPEQATMKSNIDLDPNASCIIMTDCIDPKRDRRDGKAFQTLMSALVRHLASSVPSVAIKTGFASKRPLGHPCRRSLDMAAARAQAGTPVLALDMRKRDALPASLKPAIPPSDGAKAGNDAGSESVVGSSLFTWRKPGPRTSLVAVAAEKRPGERSELIAQAKAQIDAWCEKLLQAGLAETFDVCTLAFLHDALMGDGDVNTQEVAGQTLGDGGVVSAMSFAAVPLHLAIQRARDGGDVGTTDGELPCATPGQIAEVAEWLAHRVFSDAWRVLPDRKEREERGEDYHSLWQDELYCEAVCARTLLSSPNFYNLNLQNMEGAHRLVNQLVRLDRLPPCNSLEGLLLLQDAWRDFDVAMLLAGRYKRLCKAIFAAQLFFSWLVVVGSGGGDELLEPTLSQDAGGGQWPIEDIVFALSVAVSILVSLEAVLHSKARWRQLRSGACALQSTIWRYRSRTGPFEVEESRRDSTRPEHMLCTVLNQWRTNLMAGASLKTTNLKRQHPKHVYTHFQYSGTPGPNADDHQSPTQPVRYIALRIDPMMAFYAKRIPFYTRQGLLLKTAIILFSVVLRPCSHATGS